MILEFLINLILDIQENNIMLNVENKSILVDFEELDMSSPSPRKIIRDRAIYSSRDLGIISVHSRFILSDFGEARFGTSVGKCRKQWEDVQPLFYRAPEVLLRIPWNEKIDIWNVGVLVCIYLNTDLVLPQANYSYL